MGPDSVLIWGILNLCMDPVSIFISDYFCFGLVVGFILAASFSNDYFLANLNSFLKLALAFLY